MRHLYRAATSIEVLSLNQDFMNLKQITPVTSTDVSLETSELQTQTHILSSESLTGRVVEKLCPPGSKFESVKLPPSILRRLLKLRAPSHLHLVEEAAKSVKVSALGRTRLLEVTVDSIDPQLAADFANTLANEYIDQTVETRWKMDENMNVWLTRELANTRGKLARSEDALQTYARDSGLIFTSTDANIVTEKLQQVQQQLSAATADRIEKQARKEMAQASPPESLPEVLNDPVLRDLRAKMTNLKEQIANFDATYTPEFSKTKRLRAELETLQESFSQDRAEVLSRMKNEYEGALRREQLLARDYDVQAKQVAGQGERAIQYNILKREADSNRQLYDTMLQQLKQSSVMSAMQASNVRVLDKAQVPDAPFSPNFKSNTAVGLIAGLLIGMVLLLFRQQSNRTLQEPGDVHFWTSLPELGAIPVASVSRSADRFPGHAGASRRLGRTLVPIFDQGAGSGRNPPLALVRDQSNLLADAFHSVGTSILFGSEQEREQPRTLVFTSTDPEDGKTTVIINLGIAMVEMRKRVLIIDADLRSPRVHTHFDMPNGPGLSELLAHSAFSEEELSAATRESGAPGLYVLTSGMQTNGAGRTLHSPILPKLLAKCREQYDLVLIDTPPMLQMPDARILAKLADAVVLVARADKTTRDALLVVKQRFADDGVWVMGTVLNGWQPRKAHQAYYGYHEAAAKAAQGEFSS